MAFAAAAFVKVDIDTLFAEAIPRMRESFAGMGGAMSNWLTRSRLCHLLRALLRALLRFSPLSCSAEAPTCEGCAVD